MVKIEKINYEGWDNCIKISNNEVELVVTTDVGPRIIHYGFKGEENHLKVFEEHKGKKGSNEWLSYGGHRLWHSPEEFPRTYDTDNFPCEYKILENGLCIKSPMDPKVQVEKEMEITLSDKGTIVKIKHIITNKNSWDIDFAAWAITVMAQGGREIIPQIKEGPKLLPNRTLALWTYTKMNDPRVLWLEDYIFLDQNPKLENAFKIGLPVIDGWSAYSNFGQLFVKYFDFIEDAQYPDFGYSSYETYTNNEILEMETLSPIWTVSPSESIEHIEKWELHKNVLRPENEDDVRNNILHLISL